MKINTYVIINLFVLTSLCFSCNKDDTYYLALKPVLPDQKSITYSDAKGIPGVPIQVYSSVTDYNLNKNTLYEGVTDGNGEYKVKVPQNFSSYWVRARKDTLSELRYSFNTSKSKYSIMQEGDHNIINGQKIILGTTPVKLELQVSNYDPIVGAYAQIYLSENDYKNDIIPPFNGGVIYTNTTDSKGSIIFNLLEPNKVYWFNIVSGFKTNANGTFKTNGPLEDNPDLNNVLTVGLQ